VKGDSECGKTKLLKTLAAGLIARHGADELDFAVMDPRRTQRFVITDEDSCGYAYNARMCARLEAGVTTELDRRPPDENAPLAALEAGSRRRGPRIEVLDDVSDVLTTTV
ncbi:hypothetical protein PUR61_37820, partial [Streptomyces sp. BE20]|uniref:hypothetical protein n=1 Tax=Streptomyces sp. BE20 TaxID=3002525 RepID=UPI002E77C52D